MGLAAFVAISLTLLPGCNDNGPEPAGSPARPHAAAELQPRAEDERWPEGITSRLLRAGDGKAPRAFDRVQFHYDARDGRGQRVATSRARAAIALRLHEAAPGFALVLQRMRPGELRRAWIPPELAAPMVRARDGGPLVVDLELLAVLPGAEPLPAPADLHSPPPHAERTASGLVHALLARTGESQRRAEPHDRVRVVYAGWRADGRMIDASQGRGAYAELLVSQGFPGFREALTVLREGEKRRFWIPEALAYQHYPGAVAGPLVYDIELLAVLDAPSPPPVPEDVSGPPRDAARTASGIAHRVLARGSGARKPGPRSVVEVHYSYWSSDGRLIDSTVPNGTPQRAELKYRDLPPGVAEMVQQMVVGEKRRLWIPEALASSGPVKPAKGTIVYDLELLAIYEGKRLVDSVDR